MRKYKAIEDNGGGLYLAVYDSEGLKVVYFHSGYEYVPSQLKTDIKELKNGAEPEREWEGNAENPQESYDNITSYEYGWKVVDDNNGMYFEDMGSAAHTEFGYSKEQLEEMVSDFLIEHEDEYKDDPLMIDEYYISEEGKWVVLTHDSKVYYCLIPVDGNIIIDYVGTY